MSGCRVFIGRLNPAAREKDVERFFKGYGRIRDIDLKRGFGFVEFEDPRDADDAVYELDGKELCSERVVEFASYSDLKNAIEKLSGKEINGRKIKLIEGSKRHRERLSLEQDPQKTIRAVEKYFHYPDS
ncbi:Serine/arginine-rich splicing factor 5 [Pitangus sulphuratus]|nr:Serine/arginine-rich splicing factor 5 [Pitangus sulphuratus]